MKKEIFQDVYEKSIEKGFDLKNLWIYNIKQLELFC